MKGNNRYKGWRSLWGAQNGRREDGSVEKVVRHRAVGGREGRDQGYDDAVAGHLRNPRPLFPKTMVVDILFFPKFELDNACREN